MCGIVGFIGKRRAAPMVLNALRKLEYRGYDSAGIATSVDSRICVKKGVGNLIEVERQQLLDTLPGNTGIGHVRWATHGSVTIENAHPHFDCHQGIAVVHNGIIENYRELSSNLKSKHKFTSDTDTEVIPHLIEECMARGASLEYAVFQATRKLTGSYALLAISSQDPHKIVGARKDSPLVIGLGEKENFIASDPLSFLEETNRVIFVEDGEIVTLTDSNVITIIDSDGKEVKKQIQELDWTRDAISKNGYEYFMLKEIFEQPQAMRDSLKQDRKLIQYIAGEIKKAKQVVFTACGTSRYAALIGRYAFSKLAGKFSEVVMASELQYFYDSLDKDTLVIAVSQSGETADVVQGVKKASESGATVLSLVNVTGSSLARMSDMLIPLNCGPEIAVAATKSFISQLTLFYLLAFAIDDRFDEGITKLQAVSDLIEANVLQNGVEIPRIAELLKNNDDFYYIARGINFAIAGEGALKLKEIAYVHAEGMPAGELKHGTLALIEEGTPVVVICPDDYTLTESLANAAETRARGAFVIGISDKNDEIFNEWVIIPAVEEIFYPLVSVIPLQLFAYHSAISRGLNPDRPRNLAKSVTVK